MMTRPCDAIGCDTQVPTRRFMCSRHWRLVPTAIQRQINAGYRRAGNARQLLQDKRYVGACAASIEHLAGLENQPADNTYRRLLQIRAAQEQAQ